MSISRKVFLQSSAFLAGSLLMSNLSANQQINAAKEDQWYMPDESAPHKRTWMAFIASDEIWAKRQISIVQQNLILIAKTIAKYEPVNLLVRSEDVARATELLGDLTKNKFNIVLLEHPLNDLWLRDTGASFVLNDQGGMQAINFNFNGWGEKQDYQYDRLVAPFMAKKVAVEMQVSSLTLEGGCFELDGQGSAIMTESCIINDNRNPGQSKKQIEDELKQRLGLQKIIWLKGIKGKDITDGHTDFYARFAKPGVVVVSRDMDPSSYDYKITRDNIDTLSNATDANNQALDLVILDTPDMINTKYGTQDFAAGYVGYYVCNNAVIMQSFGDKKADLAAKNKIASLFPERYIEQIRIDGIASGGGSIHCATQQEPLINNG